MYGKYPILEIEGEAELLQLLETKLLMIRLRRLDCGFQQMSARFCWRNEPTFIRTPCGKDKLIEGILREKIVV